MTNIEKMRKAIADRGIDALIASSSSNRLFATGFKSSAGMLVVTAKDAYFMTDSRYIEAAQNKIKGAKITMASAKLGYYGWLSEIAASDGVKTVGFEERSVSYDEYTKLTAAVPGTEFVRAQDMFDELRMCKTPEEIEYIVKAQRIAEKALTELIPNISLEMTESDVASELLFRMIKLGADDISFKTIAVSGKKSSMPHGVPEDIKLSKGFLTMDFGALYNGYHSDMTRTVCIGTPTEEMKKVYDTVLEAQLRAEEAAHAGMIGSELHAVAHDVIANAGYGEYFGHGLGHGIGIDIHEAPNASPSYGGILPAGAVISDEPGIYLPGRFGVRIEDMLLITENGCENLTKMPKELIIL